MVTSNDPRTSLVRILSQRVVHASMILLNIKVVLISLESSESVLQLVVVGVVTEGESVPGAGLIAAAEREAGLGDYLESREVIAAILASGALHQRFQPILGTGRLGVGLRGLGLASQAQGLCESEMRIAVIRGGLQGGTEVMDGGRGVIPGQCQSAAESCQGRVICARGVRAKQRLRTENVTPVEGNQDSDSEDLGVGWGQQIQVRFRLVQTAQSPEALG
jgi:hypothetical protein